MASPMRSKSATPTNRPCISQQGGFSPFMFGLVVGMSLFSAMSMHWARQELVRYEQEQVQRSKKDAQDVANALNFAILT